MKFSRRLAIMLVAVFVAVFISVGSVAGLSMAFDDTTVTDALDGSVLYKKANEDFVILNFADTQFADYDPQFLFPTLVGDIAFYTMDKLVEEIKPDLITLTGDQIWGQMEAQSMKKLIDRMEGYGIPWAPVQGNHDGYDGHGRGLDGMNEEELCLEYTKAPHCLFKMGTVTGYGNYMLHIVEKSRFGKEKLVYSLVMLDSLSNEKDHSYAYMKDDQIEWYKTEVAKIKKIDANAKTMAFFHIPLCEYADAWNMWESGGKDSTIGYGTKGEDVCSSNTNNGFFDVMKERDTKYIFVGHDHINNFSVLYEGVRLTYAMKTGDRCYYEPTRNGGTVIRIGEKVAIDNAFVLTGEDDMEFSDAKFVIEEVSRE